MRSFFKGIGQGILVYFQVLFHLIAFPFRVVYAVITFPFIKLIQFIQFLNSEPDERPVADVFADIVTSKDTREMLWEQVGALRSHLLRAVGVLAVAVIAAFGVAEPVMQYLSGPVGGLSKLQAIQVTEEIGVFMRVAMMLGIAATFPYIALELWMFAAPGLRPREKKLGLVGIPLATLLFLTGMAFTFFVLLPAALPFLGGFTEIAQFWTANEYFAFVTGLMIWIGLFFEFPLIVYVLTAIGLIQPQILAQQWRLAIVVIAVLAAAVTPTVDPVNMGLVMLPMTLLYFVSIGLSYLAYAGRKKQAEMQEDLADGGVG